MVFSVIILVEHVPLLELNELKKKNKKNQIEDALLSLNVFMEF